MQHTRMHFLLHFISPHDEFLRNRRKRIMHDDTLNLFADIAKHLTDLVNKVLLRIGRTNEIAGKEDFLTAT